MLSHINIGTGVDISICELAEIIKKTVGYKGKLMFNSDMPDGALRKLIDVTRLSNMGWSYKTDLETGLQKTYEWFLSENK
jgi:GDP-L-fucose synthase